MPLSSADAAKLAKYEAAYDALLMGSNTVKIETDGMSQTFGQGNVARLKVAIDNLKAADTATGSGRSRGAIRFSV